MTPGKLIPEDYQHFTPLTPEEVRRFIKAWRWIYAKTMPQCPHFYALRKEARRDENFRRFIKQIRMFGYDWQWHHTRHRYLDVDGWKYWTMGYQIESTILINRAKIEVPDQVDLFAPPAERPWVVNPLHFMAKPWHGEMFHR
jgi:hypothetical protein